VIIKDDELDCTDDEVGSETATSADVGSGRAERDASLHKTCSIPDPASEPHSPVDTLCGNR
jgi:hypothetical protein